MHHIQGNAYANDLVTCSYYNQAKTSQDLSKLFTHLGATLFSGDQRSFYDLWHRVEQEVVHNQRLEVHYCLTKANRFALFRCRICRQQVLASHGHHVPSERLGDLRRNLLTWFSPPLADNQVPTREL